MQIRPELWLPWQQIAPIGLLWGNVVITFSRLFFYFLDRILFILPGNNDIHKSLEEFEIWPDSA